MSDERICLGHFKTGAGGGGTLNILWQVVGELKSWAYVIEQQLQKSHSAWSRLCYVLIVIIVIYAYVLSFLGKYQNK